MKHTLLALLLALPLSACGGLEAPESSGSLKIDAHTVPEQPHIGQNTLVVFVFDADGTPVDGAALSVDAFMPSMGHGSTEVPVITEVGGGEYHADPLTFTMPGTWQVTVQAAAGDDDGKRVFTWEIGD